MVAARQGDVEAFRRVVESMQGRVWRYLMMLIRDSALAEDLTQETFIKVFQKLNTLSDPASFVSWTMTIARNAAYDSARARKRRPVDFVENTEMLETSAEHDPHISMEIHDALDQLDPQLKEALILIGVIGLTYAEAAATMDVPEGTMKSRVFRARAQMMSILDHRVSDAT